MVEREDIDFSYTLTDRVVRLTLGPVGRRRPAAQQMMSEL